MHSETHLLAYIALGAWVSLVVADHFGMLGSSWPALSLTSLFYLASCLGLRCLRRDGAEMPGVVPWAAAPILAWCLLIAQGTLDDAIRMQDLVEPPSKIGLALLFANGPLAALVTAAVLAYPLATLYGRRAGWVSILVALPTFSLAISGLETWDVHRISFAIAALDMVWLYVALRTVPAWAFGAWPDRSPALGTMIVPEAQVSSRSDQAKRLSTLQAFQVGGEQPYGKVGAQAIDLADQV